MDKETVDKETVDKMLEPIVEELTGGIGKNLSKAGDILATEGLKESLKRRNTEKNPVSDVRADITHYASQRLMDKMDEIEVPAEYAKIALINELETIVNKRSILDKIFGKAKIIVQTTPQDDTNSNDNIGEISDDWLNEFRDVACKKSSEEAQDLFAKVLAGEIRKPGSISLLALTTLANMDQEVAKLFNTFCSLCLVHLDDPNAIMAGDPFNIEDARLPILRSSMTDVQTKKNTNPSMKEFTEYSQSLFDKYNLNAKSFQLLLDHNLIVDNTITKYNHIWYDNELWTFKLPNNQSVLLITDIKTIPISGLALTSVGKELYNITKRHADLEYWKNISQFIQNYYEEELYIFTKS